MRRSGSTGGRPSLALRINKHVGDSKSNERHSTNMTYSSSRLSYTGGKKGPGSSSVGLGGIPNKLRKTSILGSASHMKDTRKITDKIFKSKAIRELVEFLLENNYPHPISPKILSAPSTNDFKRIFEFMSGKIDNQRSGSKYEEEIPKWFKTYGYPFPITKSMMQTVGTPHTWPSLLAALHWLKEQIQYATSIDINTLLFPPREDENEFDVEGTVSQGRLLYEFTEKMYIDYMNGQDDFQAHEEQFEKEMKKYFCKGGDIKEKAAENRRLTDELQALREQPDQLEDLKNKYSSIKIDEGKVINYCKELSSSVQQLSLTKVNIETEVSAAASEVAAIEKEVERKKHIYKTQEFSQQDVKRINMERDHLIKQTTSQEKENADLDKNIWDEELSYGKYQEKVEAKCKEYNKVANMLQLIPSSAPNAYGVDYELKPLIFGAEENKFSDVIKPALTRIKTQCIEKVNELTVQKYKEQETLEHLNEMVADKREGVSSIENQMTQIDKNIEQSKEVHNRELQKLQAVVDLNQEELNLVKTQSGMPKVDAEKALKIENSNCEKVKKECEKIKQEYADFIQIACELIVEHKTTIQARTAKIKEKFQAQLE